MNSVPTKEGLLRSAAEYEKRLEAEIAKAKSSHPNEAIILQGYQRDMKLLISELVSTSNPAEIANLQIRLAVFIRQVDAVIDRVEHGPRIN